jgi:hypothetical protein
MKKTYAYLSLAIMIFLAASCSGGGGSAVVVVPSGTATLSWVAPTQNNDNSALTNLAGFNIHYGTASGSYTNTVTVANASATTYTVKGLPKGKTYYFVVKSYNTLGVESVSSTEVSKTI